MRPVERHAVHHGGRSTASVQINEYGRLRMIVMSTGMGTRYATDDELAQYADSIAAAPNYPADGCMWIEDGKLFNPSLQTRARYIIIESRRCFPVDSRPVRCYNQNRYNSTDINAPAAP